MVDGCRWTDGPCTGTRSPHPSTTTPGWKRCSPSGSGCGSPTAATPPTASGRSARSSESTRRCCAAGRRGAATSRPNSPSWHAGSRTSTPVRRRSSSGRSWHSKRRCPPGRRSTNRARRPSNAAAWSADAGEVLGGAERGRRTRAPGHRPRTRADADGRRRRPRPAGHRDRAGVPGHLAGASRARRGGASVSPPCRRAGLSRRRGDRPRSVANELGSAHRAADASTSRPELRRADGSSVYEVAGIPPLHVSRDPGCRAAHPGGGGVPGFPRHRQPSRRPGAAGSRRERRPARPRPSRDGAATRDLRRAGAARARARRQRKDSHPARTRRRMVRGRATP